MEPIYQLREDIHLSDVNGTGCVIDLSQDRYLEVNSVGYVILQCLEHPVTIADIATDVEKEFDAPKDVIMQAARKFVALLQREHIIESVTGQ